jgi:DNA repair protein RadD
MKQLRPYQEKAVKQCWEALKRNTDPVLLMASVGAGKSLMLASILLTMQRAGKRALCLVNNAELVRNNCQTFIEEGGDASIYCAALGSKDASKPVVFGTPQSVLNGINKNETISTIKFNIIVVDEAHAINFNNRHTSFMRILRYFRQEYHDMRLLGATGTNFRFKGTPIVGSEALFKSQVGNITTEWLIENDYLIEPVFEVDKELVLDFSSVRIKKNGQFDQKQLESVVERSARLTELICNQVVHIMETQQRRGVFFFATTKKHAEEIYSHLPIGESAIILGDTPQNERTEILEKARTGRIKYLVNIAIISVGVDVPSFDTIAYLRPTESLVLLVQTMGRVLRLSPNTDKKDALVLDFAGNIERHADWDNPVLLEAVKKALDKDKPLVIACPCCNTMNTDTARRCVGKVDKENEKIDKKTGEIQQERCSYYFEFKECEHSIDGVVCGAKNDLVARECHKCKGELIDPNAKLSMSQVQKNVKEVRVIKARYGLSGTQKGFRVNCAYQCEDSAGRIGSVFEHYSPISEKALRVFYGQFVRKHCVDSSRWYPHLGDRTMVEQMLHEVITPNRLLIALEHDGTKIKKKYFD